MENRKIDGDYIATEDYIFRGMITGNLVVKSGIKFTNRGMICKDVIVEENAFFYNRGSVNGDVTGEGYAEVWGEIKGYLSSMLNTYVHKDSVINGKIYDCDEKSI